MQGVRKILVAINNSVDLVHEAIKVAGREKAWLTVLKVVPAYEGELNFTGIGNIRGVIDAGKEKFIKDIKKLAAEERALIKTRLESGAIARKIVEVATEERCDLIIMGRKKGGILKKLICGDLVERVKAQAPCLVLEVQNQ